GVNLSGPAFPSARKAILTSRDLRSWLNLLDSRGRLSSRKLFRGDVSERPKVQHSKCCVGSPLPWVQIPPSPPEQKPVLPGSIGESGLFSCLATRCCGALRWARGLVPSFLSVTQEIAR